MRVSVTQADITCGQRRSSCNCPVANAIKRSYEVSYIACGQNTVDIKLRSAERIVSYQLPSFVSLRISMYDASGVMEPFEFELTEAKQ